MNNKDIMITGLNDMPVDEFRKNGHEFIDWIADYFNNIESNTVLPNIEPGKIRSKLPLEPP